MQLTIRDVARLLRVSEDQIFRWIDQDEMPVAHVAGSYRFHRSDLLEWATLRGLKVSPEVFASTWRNGGSSFPVAAALGRGGIRHDVAGTDKVTLLAAIIGQLDLPAAIDRELLLSLLLAREAHGSTGVGDGIAIPHPRYPVVLPIDEPLIALSFLQSPIDFAASDHKPVDTLFLMICPTVQCHFQLLTQLACVLRDERFREVVRRRAGADVILGEAQRFQQSVESAGAA